MAAKNQYHLTPNDFAMVARRRSGLLFVSFIIVLLASLAIALALPPVYKSTGTILVESPQIPPALVPMAFTAYAEERIQVISQKIMTHDNLLRIAHKYDLYSEDRKTQSASETIDRMRQSISLTPVQASLGGKRDDTVAFSVSFEDPAADTAQRVANELVTLFLSENARMRAQRATQTTAFLTREADKLQAELAKREEALASYKQRYSNALPEHLEMRMAMLQRLEGDLRDAQREFRATEEELRFLNIELSSARAGYGDKVMKSSPGTESLGELKTDYERLGTRLTGRHPDMQALRRRIEALELTAASDTGSPLAVLSETDVRTVKIQAEISAAGTRLQTLKQQEDDLRVRIAEIEKDILQTPQVQRALTGIMRDYANAREKYEEVRAKQIDAGISESLEEENRSEHFTLLNSPLFPDSPAKPDRQKILLAGIFFAFANTGGLVVLLGLLNPKVNGAGALTQLMRQSPLAIVPYVKTRADYRRKRLRGIVFIALGLVALLIATALVHFFYMRVDILLMKMIAALG